MPEIAPMTNNINKLIMLVGKVSISQINITSEKIITDKIIYSGPSRSSLYFILNVS